MKYILIPLLLFVSITESKTQVAKFEEIPNNILSHLDKMGLEEASLLNNYEQLYFNEIFRKVSGEFNFEGKKIGFLYMGTISNKKEFFTMEKSRFNQNLSPNQVTLYVFDANQKEESGGYDGVILYWSKRLLSVKEVVRKIKIKNKLAFIEFP